MAQMPNKKVVTKPVMTATSIGLDILHTAKGHLAMVLESDDEKKRRKLAKKIVMLIREEKALIIVKPAQGAEVRVTGYDPKTNEWITKPLTKKQAANRIPAQGSKATVVAPLSGG
jgi:uncharacterized protein YajQ (UPF0234 family)